MSKLLEPDRKRLKSLSVVFPAYNDGGSIASMVAAASIASRQVTDDFEIIVVNDGSSDYTQAFEPFTIWLQEFAHDIFLATAKTLNP